MYTIPKNLLSKGVTNTKTAKNSLETYILYLAPYTQNSKGINLCPNASDGCVAGCLFTSGRGRFSNVANSRINKSNYYVENRDGFLEQLANELNKIDRRALKEQKQIAIRLNGTSDIDLIGQLAKKFSVNVFNHYPNLVFYDYTKILGKIEKYKDVLGRDYHLTYSRSENTSFFDLKQALIWGANVAIVFNEIPEYYSIYGDSIQVIDGDESDIIMMYNKGKILGLKAKGDAKKDRSNFVIR